MYCLDANIIIFSLKYQNLDLSRRVLDVFSDDKIVTASVCLAQKLTLIINKTKHFQNIKNLKIQDWSKNLL